jgi:serine/threonine protein kinase
VSAPRATTRRYRRVRALGHGGMATVELAHDLELDRPVALKRLAENLAANPEFKQRFLREARLAARLAHPNIVAVYDVGEEDGRPFIVMEYVEGETLSDLVRRRGRLEPAEAVSLALQACSGLETAHEAGLVHRDIKPQNLLLTPEGTLKIADFGIARSLDATQLTEAGTVLGTAAYVAPEQAAGDPVTAAADIYALGAVLYELLIGRPPYVADTLQELFAEQRRGSIAPVRELAPDVPAPLEDAVMRALARDPTYRPESAEAFAGELGGPPTAVTRIERPAVSRRGPRWALAAALGLGAALVLVLGLALSFRGSSKQPEPAARPLAAGPPAQQARAFATWLRDHAGG